MTAREAEVLAFIAAFIDANLFSPSVREIAAGLRLSSPAKVQDCIERLLVKGHITRVRGKARSIEIAAPGLSLGAIPLGDLTAELKRRGFSIIDRRHLAGPVAAGSGAAPQGHDHE